MNGECACIVPPTKMIRSFPMFRCPLCVTLQAHTCCFSSSNRRFWICWKRCCWYRYCCYFCRVMFLFSFNVFFLSFFFLLLSAFFELCFLFRMEFITVRVSSVHLLRVIIVVVFVVFVNVVILYTYGVLNKKPRYHMCMKYDQRPLATVKLLDILTTWYMAKLRFTNKSGTHIIIKSLASFSVPCTFNECWNKICYQRHFTDHRCFSIFVQALTSRKIFNCISLVWEW